MNPIRAIAKLALASVVLIALAAQDKKAGDKEPCTLIIKIDPKAKLEIDGQKTELTGSSRRFTTPPLDPKKNYYYTLTASWEPNNYTRISRKREVDIKAGATINVDLTKREKELDDIKIRFVPTPPEVVDVMCQLGRVGPEDVVYDLGCGDGRIVIRAVKKFMAKRGVGVDIDPKRIEESKANAAKANLANKVEFRESDVFKVEDLDKASVVMLYMSNELNEQLRPILLKTLKPGSRIVSHRFLMGDWKPERTEVLEVDGEEYNVHLWIIPEKLQKLPEQDGKAKPMDTDKKPSDKLPN